jgi:DNA-binding response OmpR family regulator
MRLLVVEDEPRISELIKAALERAEFVVDTVRVRADAREALANTPYDAAILDLGLPDGDGLDLLAELRPAGNHIPVLILTARDAVEQRVLGLDAGADDYLVKPFAMSELIARTKALLRRPGAALGTTLKAGNIVFDTIGRDASIAGMPLQLPRREASTPRTGRPEERSRRETLRHRHRVGIECRSSACTSLTAQAAGGSSERGDSYRARHWLFAR